MAFIMFSSSLTLCKPIFAHLGQYSKCLSDFKHSRLSQMTTKGFSDSLKHKQEINPEQKVVKCGIYHVRFFTHIGKPFFVHFGQFSKHLSDFKHSRLSQSTT